MLFSIITNMKDILEYQSYIKFYGISNKFNPPANETIATKLITFVFSFNVKLNRNIEKSFHTS